MSATILAATKVVNSDMLTGHGSRVLIVPVVSAASYADTLPHDPTTADLTVALVDTRLCGGRKTLLVNNGFNQSVTVKAFASFDGVNGYAVGTGTTVAAATVGVIDSSLIEQLDQPFPYFSIQITAAVAPGSGTISVTMAVREE